MVFMQQLTENRRRHLLVLVAILGIVLFINIFSSSDYDILSVGVNLELKLGHTPQTRIMLPPVGEIRAQTHWLPVQLNIELKSLDLGLVRGLVFAPAVNAASILDDAREVLWRL